MGLIRADIQLANVQQPDLEPMSVTALVDSGAMHMCIPQHVANQLDLPVHEQRPVTLADGAEKQVDYVGPLQIRFANRQCLVGALVLGDEPLLGAISMEDMDLVVHPSRGKLEVNPANPNYPMSVAKGLPR